MSWFLITVGTAIYANSVIHKSRYLSYNLNEVENYFNQNPNEFDPIGNYVLNALENPAKKNDYDRYKKLAEVMGLENIPPYLADKNKQPNILANPEQEQNPQDWIYENPSDSKPNQPNIIYTPEGKKIDISTEFPIEKPESWEDYLLLKQNSQELADNMAQAGMGVKPKDYAAHHLIPATDSAAQDARDILSDYGIGINDAINGVYLPRPKAKKSTNGIEHNGRHPREYAETINNLIIDADSRGGKEEVIKTLNDIKNKLKNAPRNGNWRNVL